MLLVSFKRNWFDPSGNLRRQAKNPHEIQDDWKDSLPTGSIIHGEDGKDTVVEAKDPDATAEEETKEDFVKEPTKKKGGFKLEE